MLIQFQSIIFISFHWPIGFSLYQCFISCGRLQRESDLSFLSEETDYVFLGHVKFFPKKACAGRKCLGRTMESLLLETSYTRCVVFVDDESTHEIQALSQRNLYGFHLVNTSCPKPGFWVPRGSFTYTCHSTWPTRMRHR